MRATRRIPAAEVLRRLTPQLLAVWWVAMMLPAFLSASAAELDASDLTAAADSTASGNIQAQLTVLALAVIGAAHLPVVIELLRTSSRSRRDLRVAITLLAAYTAWGLSTLAWSAAPDLTVRRLIQFSLLAIGSLGLGVGYYGSHRDGAVRFARHLCVAAGISLAALCLPRLPQLLVALDASTRIDGIGLGTNTAMPIAFGAIAAAAVLLDPTHRPVRMSQTAVVLFIAACGAGLYLQKVRGIAIVVMLVAAVAVSHHLGRSARRAAVLFVAVGVVFSLLMTDTGALDVGGTVGEQVTRSEDADTVISLTGRVPLWEALLPYVAERPLEGWGFGGFWTGERFLTIEAVVRWPAVVAHNGFFDELLATGLIGLVLFLALWFRGIRTSVRLSRASGLSEDRFITYLLVTFLLLNLTQSIMQTWFQYPFYVALTALFIGASRAQGGLREWESEAEPATVRVTASRLLPPARR